MLIIVGLSVIKLSGENHGCEQFPIVSTSILTILLTKPLSHRIFCDSSNMGIWLNPI